MSKENYSRWDQSVCFTNSMAAWKADLLSDSTKDESNYFQNSIDSRRYYARPRTKSPFPPLKNNWNPKVTSIVKQSESFNSSLDK